MSVKRHSALLLLLVGACLALGACGSKGPVGNRIRGRTLTVYLSGPLHGASSVAAAAALNGARLALKQVNGRIGHYRVMLKPLDDSGPGSDGWDPSQTTIDARLALQDPATVAYLGEFNSGASAISIPLLNRLEIAQVSSASSAVGLTSSGPGASPGEPEKYYPTGTRTFASVAPNDAIQALAQVRLQRSMGCTRTFALDDGEVDGEDTAISFALTAQSVGLRVIGVQSFDRLATDYSSLAASVAQAGADCVLISAISERSAARVTAQVAHALPTGRIFAVAALADSTYADPAKGGIPAPIDGRVLLTAPALDAAQYPASGRRFLAEYTRRYGTPEPAAIFGYEAMSLVLNAIARATDRGRKQAQRSKVLKEIFSTRDRHSVLGTYSINPDGDTTIRRYGVWQVVAGRLAFWKAVEA